MFYNNFYKSKLLCFIFLCSFNVVYSAEIYFSPEDKIADRLVNLIDGAQTKVHVAVFVFTYKKLADALIRAKNRGLDVQVVVDATCLESTNGKIDLLKRSNIEVFVFKNRAKKYGPRMHNKFTIVDGKQVATGSFNWTWSAHKINEENIVILNEKTGVLRYCNKFELLKKKCIGLNLIKNTKKTETQKLKDGSKNYRNLKQKMVKFLQKVKNLVKKKEKPER